MKRLVYTPKVNAWIKTDFGVIDVSDLIISGGVTRKINQVSSANLVLRNPKKENGKMLFTEQLLPDGSFGPLLHPMDPIIISLTRLKDRSIEVFTGYCDKTPYLQLYAGPVNVEASCTLKRLQYTFWDPGLPFSWEFLAQYGWFPDRAHGGIANPSATVPSTPPSTKITIPHGPKNGRVLVPGAGDKQQGHVTKKFATRQALNQLPGHKPQDIQVEQQTPLATPTVFHTVWMFEMAGPDAAEVMIDYSTGEVLQWETNHAIYSGNRWSSSVVREGEGESLSSRPVTNPVNFQDGSIGMLLMGVLQNIGGWDASTIYIEPLPSGIGPLVTNLFTQFQSSVTENHQIESAFQDLLTQLVGTGSLGTGLPGSTSGNTSGGGANTSPGSVPGAGGGTHLQGIGSNNNPTPGPPGSNPGTPTGKPGKPRKGANGRLQDAIDVAEVFWKNDWNFGLCDPAVRRAHIKYGNAHGFHAETCSKTTCSNSFDADHKNRNCGARVAVDLSVVSHFSWPKFCRTICHEYGHMLKWHHSDANGPCNIMESSGNNACSIPALAKRPQGSVKP